MVWPMPITYEIDRVRRLVRTKCVGFVTLDEVIAHFTALENDPSRVGIFDVLVDFRRVTSVPETGQLREVADRIAPDKSDLQFGACAIVATDPALVGTAKLFSVFTNKRFRATTVVRTVEAAERWLAAADESGA